MSSVLAALVYFALFPVGLFFQVVCLLPGENSADPSFRTWHYIDVMSVGSLLGPLKKDNPHCWASDSCLLFCAMHRPLHQMALASNKTDHLGQFSLGQLLCTVDYAESL